MLLCKICLNVQLSRDAQKHSITLFSFHKFVKLKTAILEMEYGERLGSVTRRSTFLNHIRTHISLQIFELSEI